MSTKVITVGLSGPSSGGKTTIARYLRKILSNSIILHQDDFYRAEVDLPIDPLTSLANWDCPGAIDFTEMLRVLHHVQQSGEFPQGFESKEDKNLVGAKERSSPIPMAVLDGMRQKILGPNSINNETLFLIVDGFLLYADEHLRDAIDVKFFLTAPYSILKERRESREGYVTMEGYWVDPPGYFDDIVWPNYVAFNGPFLKAVGDEHYISNSNTENADEVMTHNVHIVDSGSLAIQDMVHSVVSTISASFIL